MTSLPNCFRYNLFIMRNLLLSCLLAVLALASCSPTRFAVNVDLRMPSKSSYALEGKTVSVTCLKTDNTTDSLLQSSLAEGFASALENDYFGGQQVIGIYNKERTADVDYSSKESMINLLIETGADVAFLFDAGVVDPASEAGKKTFKIKLYAYDAMNPADTVNIYKGVAALSSSDLYETQGSAFGRESANIFLSTWKSHQMIFYYDLMEPWYTAAQYVEGYRFKEAMDLWMTLLDSKNMLRRSCAEYNIATACFVMGNKALAREWLDMSDSHYLLPESSSLRRLLEK